MTESLGFLELACCARAYSREVGLVEQQSWNPLSEFTLDELRTMVAEGWRIEETDEAAKEEFGQVSYFARLNLLQNRFGLSFREKHMLFLAVLPELDLDFQEAFRYLGEPDGWPSFKLENKIFFSAALGEEDEKQNILRYSLMRALFLKDTNQHGRMSSLSLKPEVTAYLMGLEDEVPDMSGTSWDLDAEGDPEANRAFEKMRRMIKKDPGSKVFFLYGPEGIGKKKAAKRLTDELDIRFWPPELFTAGFDDGIALKEKLFEASLHGAAAAIIVEHAGEPEMTRFCAIVQYMAPFLPFVFLIGKERPLHVGVREYISVELKPLGMEEQYTVWKKKAEDYALDSKESLRDMSNKYRLTPGQIERCLVVARRQADLEGTEVLTERMLSESASLLLRNHFDSRAARVEQHYGWNDLILPDRQKKQLRSACAQMKWKHKVLEEWGMKHSMAYGTGISLVFAGPPGTGKTMAAQVLARELWMELYKVELASVVSKYVGETEKRLKLVFEQARQSQVILFFDEADVLFGKRTEVKDSGDKYSNMEAAFLLQEMENFEGIVILATNLIQNMDEAFKRRLKFIIDFPFPDKGHRQKIWESAFPREMPLSKDIDLEFLSERFELTGSGIKNVVYRAAFFAAEEGTEVEMRQLIWAVKIEYEKSMGTFPEELAGPYSCYLREWRE
ncbi:MAG: ATP-binding protein [Hungatella sp.]